MKCQKCHKKNSEHTKYCAFCGEKLDAPAESEQESNQLTKPTEKSKKRSTLFVIVIGVLLVAIVICCVTLFSTGRSKKDSRTKGLPYCLTQDDGLYLLEGKKAYRAASVGDVFSPEIRIFDDEKVYLIKDIYYEPILRYNAGSLSVADYTGEETLIDTNVDYDSIVPHNGDLWYTRADDGQSMLYKYTGKKTIKIANAFDNAYIFGFTDKRDSFYYIENKKENGDLIRTLYLFEDGKSKEILKAGESLRNYFHIYNSDHGFYIVTKDFNDDSSEFNDYPLKLYELDGTKQTLIAEGFFGYPTFYRDKILFVNEDDHLVVMNTKGKMKVFKDFLPFDIMGQRILMVDYDEESGLFFLISDDNLYSLDLSKGINQIDMTRVVQSLPYHPDMYTLKNNFDTLYMIDDGNLKSVDLSTEKSKLITTNKVDALVDIPASDFVGCAYINSDNSLYIYNGKKSILLADDADSVDNVAVAFGGKKVLWLVDEKLYMADISGKNQHVIAENIDELFDEADGHIYLKTTDRDILYL
ncbi:MAG: hypothetical protein AB1Z19_01725, partial [Eubacteriales bacterium]